MGRSAFGEREGVFSVLRLVQHEVGASGDIESHLRDILEIFLKRVDVREIFDAASTDVAGMSAIATYIAQLLANYRLISSPLDFNDFDPPLSLMLSNYRLLTNQTFSSLVTDSLSFLDGPNTRVDLKAKFDDLELTAARRAPVQLFTEQNYSWQPQVAKTVKRYDTRQAIVQDVAYYYNITRTRDPVYSLGNPDDTEGYKGRIALYKDGEQVSVLQFMPTPLAHAYNLLSVTSDERYVLNSPSDHSGSHPQSSGSGGSPVLSSLSIDTLTGSANLGKFIGILTDGTAVTSGQSTLDLHPSLTDYNALLASVASLQAQVAVMSFQISALQNSQLQVRINGVLQPCSRLSFDSGSVSTMYTASVDHCHVWTGGVPLDDPS